METLHGWSLYWGADYAGCRPEGWLRDVRRAVVPLVMRNNTTNAFLVIFGICFLESFHFFLCGSVFMFYIPSTVADFCTAVKDTSRTPQPRSHLFIHIKLFSISTEFVYQKNVFVSKKIRTIIQRAMWIPRIRSVMQLQFRKRRNRFQETQRNTSEQRLLWLFEFISFIF